MKIVFQNQHFVALDKPAGWLSVPSRMGTQDPRPCLGTQLQEKLNQQIYPVHRLDVEVSGLILYALSPAAHRHASACFEMREVSKQYEALSERPQTTEFKIDKTYEWHSKLLRGKKRAFESPAGKPSITLAHLIALKSDFFYWHLSPLTGRPHQLRYELSRHGGPIVGDSLYGSTKTFDDGIALRALSLSLPSENELTKNFGFPRKLSVASKLA